MLRNINPLVDYPTHSVNDFQWGQASYRQVARQWQRAQFNSIRSLLYPYLRRKCSATGN